MEHSRHREAVVLTVTLSDDERTLVIALDDGSEIEVAPDAAEARGITPGLLLSADRVEALDRAAARKQIARQLFLWLDRRPRSRAEFRRRLVDRGHEGAVCDEVLDRFVEQGLVDDRAFAGAFVRTQLLRRPVGPFWLLSRLRQEGVGRSDAQAAVDAEIDDEVGLATAALRRKRFDLSSESDRARSLRFLKSRGFAGGAAVAALKIVRGEAAEDEAAS